MVRIAAKKRRRGTAKVSQKQKNKSRYIKPKISDSKIRASWDPKVSIGKNVTRLGLVTDPNTFLEQCNAPKIDTSTDKSNYPRLFDIPCSDDLTKVDANARRRVMSEEEQKYLANLIAKYGEDYKGMAHDVKKNYLQYAVGKLRRLCARFLLLDENQRLVPVPEAPQRAAKAL
eukprot:CAMPEP_0113942044 /NCGR_PEP_ID=MMETSP1339-20121228/7826_1 /TAXON_ID=94617 /ORGANISM="Fibrocapsa japonica" /LENGTH=172 /DNA_ID=CAMNT_0000946353 /DNA_START=40 /DNA_END=558 /DNA_ORIENTATION=- /assembly_acc=CAM_ASM_000762